MTNYIYLGILPDSLEDGRPLAFGTEASLTSEQQKHNKRLLESSALVEVVKPQTKASKKNDDAQEVSN